jgi:hypothetical protein
LPIHCNRNSNNNNDVVNTTVRCLQFSTHIPSVCLFAVTDYIESQCVKAVVWQLYIYIYICKYTWKKKLNTSGSTSSGNRSRLNSDSAVNPCDALKVLPSIRVCTRKVHKPTSVVTLFHCCSVQQQQHITRKRDASNCMSVQGTTCIHTCWPDALSAHRQCIIPHMML